MRLLLELYHMSFCIYSNFIPAKAIVASDESGDENKSDSDGSEKIKKKFVSMLITNDFKQH